MSKRIATKEGVVQAANSLLADGYKPQNITYMLIREKVGGGSNSTILPFLHEWMEEQQKRQVNSSPIPAELASKLHGFFHDVWSAANDCSFSKVARELEMISVLSAEGERLQEEIARLDDVLEALETENLHNLRRFVGCLDAIRQTFNEVCGGLLEAVMTSAPELTAKVKGFQSRVNAECDQARDDQATLLSALLHKRRLGSPATATPPPDHPVTVAQQLAGLA